MRGYSAYYDSIIVTDNLDLSEPPIFYSTARTTLALYLHMTSIGWLPTILPQCTYFSARRSCLTSVDFSTCTGTVTYIDLRNTPLQTFSPATAMGTVYLDGCLHLTNLGNWSSVTNLTSLSMIGCKPSQSLIDSFLQNLSSSSISGATINLGSTPPSSSILAQSGVIAFMAANTVTYTTPDYNDAE